MDVFSGNVTGYQENIVSYTLIQQEQETTDLAIVLPGFGYTIQAPLLHFATGVFLNKEYDV